MALSSWQQCNHAEFYKEKWTSSFAFYILKIPNQEIQGRQQNQFRNLRRQLFLPHDFEIFEVMDKYKTIIVIISILATCNRLATCTDAFGTCYAVVLLHGLVA